MAKILVVEDERYLAESIAEWLRKEGHHVDISGDAHRAEEFLSARDYDVIILDIVLPGITGLELCRRYRKSGGTARLLIVSARGTSSDKEDGLDAGADDYISKPFDLKELAARVRALMRRSVSIVGHQLVAGDLVLDLTLYEARRGEHRIKLLPQEFAILQFLMGHPNSIFTTEQLIIQLWQGNASIDTLRTHIKMIRKKIDLSGFKTEIRTIHGIGYCLQVVD